MDRAELGEVAGTLFLGYMLNWALFGVLSAQVYLYYLAFPNEPWTRNCLVFGVYIFEMVQVFMLTDSGFQTFAYGFGNPASLNEIGTIWITVPLMSSIVAFVVQSFYAYRISVLSESKLTAAVILFVALIGLGGGVGTAVIGADAKVFSNFLGKNTSITTAFWNGGGALCDVIIATYMVYYLSKRSTGWKSTQDTVNRIIRLVIETGSLTAMIAIVNLALSVLPGHPTYFQVASAILGKLYSNSMMVMLNSRINIGRLSDRENTAVNSSNAGSKPGVSLRSGGQVGINVTRTQEEWSSYQLNEIGTGKNYSTVGNDKEFEMKRSELAV